MSGRRAERAGGAGRSGRATADERLERILYVLPVAARTGGVSLTRLANELESSEEELLADLDEVMTRVDYHPTGGADDLQVEVEAAAGGENRVRAFVGGKLGRPPRLSPREALALALGLRAVAADDARPGRRERFLKLAARLERDLAVRMEGEEPEALLSRVHVRDGPEDPEGLRSLLFEAASARRRCRILYLKPDAAEPEEREVEPYAVVYATGRWYVLGHSPERKEIRAFRLDRVLEAEQLSSAFVPPEEFDPDAYVREGYVYAASEAPEAVVRYSPRIARWMVERGEGEEREDGSVVACRATADPSWAVRHALGYGPDAEILEPADLRALVASAARRVAEAHGEGRDRAVEAHGEDPE